MQLSAISAHKDMPHPWVYQNIRNLQGVVRSTTDNTPLNVTLPPFLNDATKDYLVSHGYETSVIMEIMTASITSLGVVEFLGNLCPKGLPVKEAEYLWRLISSKESQGRREG